MKLTDKDIKGLTDSLDENVIKYSDSVDQLDKFYSEKESMIEELRELPAKIQNREIDAVINIPPNIEKTLTNQTKRDAYKKNSSKSERDKLAQLQGKVDSIDSKIDMAKYSMKKYVNIIKAIQTKMDFLKEVAEVN